MHFAWQCAFMMLECFKKCEELLRKQMQYVMPMAALHSWFLLDAIFEGQLYLCTKVCVVRLCFIVIKFAMR